MRNWTVEFAWPQIYLERGAGAQAAAADGAERQRAAALQALAGFWQKDKAASDSMDAACDAIALNFLMRRAIG
jgi:hypothetical protein